MIAKVIHYCWFGKNEKSELINRCINSWRKYCPDYQIIEWNEDNFNINDCDYTRQAYLAGKWAFVSDYARLKILYENGGIYLIGMNDYSKYAKHWEGNSWKDEESRQFQLERREKGWKLMRFLRNPTVMNWLERHGEMKISKIYVFITYKLLNNGPVYFVKRLIKRKKGV